MADTLAQGGILWPRGEHRSLSASSERRSRPSFAGLSRSSSPKVQPLRSKFHGRRLVIPRRGRLLRGYLVSTSVQMALSFKKAVKWWEMGLQPNMKEIESAEDLVNSLLTAGDKLVIVDFLSPGCGGCRALHPKICQLAELNSDVSFLQINYEKHKSMCYSLNVHVLPFFRFYRGAQGRLCSFSCTNATIKKFKDALAKHTTDRCSLGPARGLEESELLALDANKDLSFKHTRKPVPVPGEAVEKAPANPKLLVAAAPKLTQESEDKSLAAAGR